MRFLTSLRSSSKTSQFNFSVTVNSLVIIIALTLVRNTKYFFLEPFTVQFETWLVIMVCVYNYSKPYIKVACYDVQEFLINDKVSMIKSVTYLDCLLKIFLVLVSFHLINEEKESGGIFKVVSPEVRMLATQVPHLHRVIIR